MFEHNYSNINVCVRVSVCVRIMLVYRDNTMSGVTLLQSQWFQVNVYGVFFISHTVPHYAVMILTENVYHRYKFICMNHLYFKDKVAYLMSLYWDGFWVYCTCLCPVLYHSCLFILNRGQTFSFLLSICCTNKKVNE